MQSLAPLAACVKALDLKTDTFDNRILAQKTMYLFQLMGADLGYRFSWELRGPYARELAVALDQVTLDWETLKGYTLRREVDERAGALRAALDTVPDGMSRADWAELLASVHYLKHISPEPKQKGLPCIIGHLRTLKPDRFTDQQLDDACNTLKSLGLWDVKTARANGLR
jgi:hypothetical protein